MTAKIALVTGGSSGIGRAAAIALYAAGWDVVTCARRKEALEETTMLMRDQRKIAGLSEGRVAALCVDMKDEQEVKTMFDTIERDFGRLDLLFNNAGIPQPKVPIDQLDFSTFKEVIDVNINSVFLCCQHAIRLMKRQSPSGGRIINNGSISAHVPRPLSVAYTMSKHAILGLTKCIALDHREDNIACSQLDIGNAQSAMSEKKSDGVLQANGSIEKEPLMDVKHCGEAIVYMANLPLGVNVLSQTLMATNMPFVGRG